MLRSDKVFHGFKAYPEVIPFLAQLDVVNDLAVAAPCMVMSSSTVHTDVVIMSLCVVIATNLAAVVFKFAVCSQVGWKGVFLRFGECFHSADGTHEIEWDCGFTEDVIKGVESLTPAKRDCRGVAAEGARRHLC